MDAQPDLHLVVAQVGLTIVNEVGAAIGPLYGTAFVRAGKAVAGKETFDGADVAAMLEAARRASGAGAGALETLRAARDVAARCAVNALAAIKGVVGDLERVERVVKVVGFVSSTPDFTAQPEVMNAASDLLQQVFGEPGRHARSAVGMVVLPRDTCVEVELIVQVRENKG